MLQTNAGDQPRFVAEKVQTIKASATPCKFSFDAQRVLMMLSLFKRAVRAIRELERRERNEGSINTLISLELRGIENHLVDTFGNHLSARNASRWLVIANKGFSRQTSFESYISTQIQTTEGHIYVFRE
jgi:hypothetical protein